MSSSLSVLEPDEALDRLLTGNRRFVGGMSIHPHADFDRLRETAEAQAPFAIIHTCADSRIAPSILFDQGLGDLFVTRVAGNFVDNSILGSVEYAVEHLGCTLVMVLGHERCGALQAALQVLDNGSVYLNHIRTLVESLRPAILSCTATDGNRLEAAIEANVRASVQHIATCPDLSKRIAAGTLRVVGARYDLDTGDVTCYP